MSFCFLNRVKDIVNLERGEPVHLFLDYYFAVRIGKSNGPSMTVRVPLCPFLGPVLMDCTSGHGEFLYADLE